MVKAYILVRFHAGFESSAVSQMSVTPGVSEVNLVFGHWDAIAVAEAKNINELTRLVISQIRGIQGVQDTETLLQAQA